MHITQQSYRAEALAAIHETVAALHEIGAINEVTMREFDAACLQVVPGLKSAETGSVRGCIDKPSGACC